MKYFWPILLQALALAVLFAEIVLPSFGLLSLLALTLGAYSWYFILTRLPGSAVLTFGIANLVLIPVAIRLGFLYLGRSPISHRTDVGRGSGLEDLDRALDRYVGTVAVVEAALRPTGKIRVGDDVHEAQTAGEWIDAGRAVRVLSVNGSRFQVEAAPD